MKTRRRSKGTPARPARAKRPHSIEEAHSHALAMLASRPEVTGVDIGPKYVDGRATKQLCVRVHVREKRRDQALTDSERIPKRILGIETDVIVGRYRRHGTTAAPSGRFDPVLPGISVGNPKAEAGTIGLIVYDEDTGDACVLGSYHVLAGPDAVEGDAITQPARFDGGALPGDAIATLHRAFLPGPWGDAAIARLNASRRFGKGILGSNVSIDRIILPEQDLLVEKSGRTTGVTRGRIEALGTYFYPEVPTGVNGFRVVPDGTSSGELCAPGDSGSVYYVQGTTTGVGLHCAGGDDPNVGEVGIACSLSRVCSTLHVSLQPK